MHLAVQIEPLPATPPAGVQYRWDTDTEILTAILGARGSRNGNGVSGSVGLEGSDGSWVILDVSDGEILGVEVAVWPDLRKLKTLAPPENVQDARISLPSDDRSGAVASIEMDTALVAESDPAERTIHFRVGKPRRVRTLRIASDVLIDVDARSRIAGVWLLNVPPCPDPA
jgi:hypothetical protein